MPAFLLFSIILYSSVRYSKPYLISIYFLVKMQYKVLKQDKCLEKKTKK